LKSMLSLAACAALALPLTADAAEMLNIRPGLWDFTQTMTMSGAPLYIEQMTPAQRAAYAKSWEKDVGKPTTDEDQECITEKDIKEATLFEDNSQKGKQCTQKAIKQTKTAWVVTMECKDAKTSTTTQLDYSAPSPDRLVGSLKSSTKSPNGTTVFDFKFNGKWVGASCPDEDEDSSSDAETSGEEAAE
jgi:hypothetical protein